MLLCGGVTKKVLKDNLTPGKPVDCLDRHVRPMVVESDNVETGIVVDIISEQPNIDNITSINDPRYAPWLEKRRFTENIFKKFNLLSNQILLSKTYPTNSGWPLSGAEKVQREHTGGNVMQPCCSSVMMLDIIKGIILPEPKEKSIDYVKSLFFHRLYTGQSTFGFGLPPGTLLENKLGLAYDTIEDIAHITLPNKKEFILSAFSNGFKRSIDTGILGRFVENLIDQLKLNQDGPPKLVINSQSRNLVIMGDWQRDSIVKDRIGEFFFKSSKNTNEIHLNIDVPQDGLYLISIYHPSVSNAHTSTLIKINHAYGTETTRVNQRLFSRYTKLGDFVLKKGSYQRMITISSEGLPNQSVVVFNAIKLEMYPNCQGIPGNLC